MSINIAVAGKGGTGKTSVTALIIRYLLMSERGPILAIDADANANLADSLGFKVGRTVGSIIASFNEDKINIPPGMTKEAYLEFRLNDALVESKGLDLLTMGRGEGAECYCYPNLMLRKFADTLMKNYTYTVMDNEAGMEHLSRRTTENVDHLLFVSDHSMKGVRTIARLRELVKELKLKVKRQWVIINFLPNGIDPLIRDEMTQLGIEPSATIPIDEVVREYDLKFKPLIDLPDDSKTVKAINNFMAKMLETQKIQVKG